MAKLFSQPTYQALDANGDAISGARLFFYLTGTSTKHDTYTDNALSVAHANPVVADSAGRFAPIYLQDADYKVILAIAGADDPPTTPIQTIDPVHGAPVVDASSTSEQAFINVKDNGDDSAKGDGVEATDGTLTSGSPVLASTAVNFLSSDVGKDVVVQGAGAAITITGAAAAPAMRIWQNDDSESGASAWVEETTDFNDAGAGDVDPFPSPSGIGDVFYVGSRGTFTGLSIIIGTSGAAGVVVWEYHNGTTWTALSGVTDDTVAFTAAPGTYDVTWAQPGDWGRVVVRSGQFHYYVRARLTTVYTTDPVLDQGTLKGGLIRITATAHGLGGRQKTSIQNIAGTIEANGYWSIHAFDANNFDLVGSSFVNAYTSGGTAHGLLAGPILSVASGDATLSVNAGVAITGEAVFVYGTDDGPAINAALAEGSGLTLAPDGVYLTSEILAVDTEGQQLIGASMVLTRFLSIGSVDVVQVTKRRCKVRDFEIDGMYSSGGNGLVVGAGGENAQSLEMNIRARRTRVNGVLWEQGSFLYSPYTVIQECDGDGFRATAEFDDNSHGDLVLQVANCNGWGVRFNAPGVSVASFSNHFAYIKTLGCVLGGVFIGGGKNTGRIFSERNFGNPIEFPAPAVNNKIWVVGTDAATEQAVDSGSDNLLLGSNNDVSINKGVTAADTLRMSSLGLTGSLETVQTADRAWESTLEGTSQDGTVTHKSAGAGMLNYVFERLQVDETNGRRIENILRAGTSMNFGTVGANTTATQTITVTGATTAMEVMSAFSNVALPAGIVVGNARVSAADTVTITVGNLTGGGVAVNQAFQVWVIG